MSYCRWSDDDYQCDVYVYESPDGFVTNVARSRPVFTDPLPPPVRYDPEDAVPWFERHRKVMDMVGAADLARIGLPLDGRSYMHATPGECADNLIRLREVGYRVPDYAIRDLQAEARVTP